MRKIIFTIIGMLATALYGENVINTPVPINASYSNHFTTIRNQIFHDKDYVLALMPTTFFADARFGIVIVRFKNNAYQVESISYKIQNSDEDLTKKKYEQLSIKEDHKASRVLDSAVVEQLVKILNSELAAISYQISRNDNLDNPDFEVYTSDKEHNTFCGLFQNNDISNLFAILAKFASEDEEDSKLANTNLLKFIEGKIK